MCRWKIRTIRYFSESVIGIIGMCEYDIRTFFACQDSLGRSWRHNPSFAPCTGNPHYATDCA